MRRKSPVAHRIAAAVAVSLLLGWWGWSPRDRPDRDTVRVTFLDVGQGDAAVVELPDGPTVLIDGGATFERFDMGRNVVGPFLWNRGIRTIDRVIGTHPQVDHIGGLAWILRHFPTGQYWGTVLREVRRFTGGWKTRWRLGGSPSMWRRKATPSSIRGRAVCSSSARRPAPHPWRLRLAARRGRQ
jgi:glyoxylase-like metal-dependent hydrolase (beta-lactamase superfamily II)